DSFGYRVSTRSTYSVQDNANNELQSPNNEEIEQEVQYRVKEVCFFLMIFRLNMFFLR
ncbi:unnamed protein product, partial [Rotaria magnacalcarata]